MGCAWGWVCVGRSAQRLVLLARRRHFGPNDEPALCSGGGVGPVGTLWDCVPRVCGGGGGCVGGGVPMGAVPALSWCGGVSLEGIHIIHNRERMCVWPTVCVSSAW